MSYSPEEARSEFVGTVKMGREARKKAKSLARKVGSKSPEAKEAKKSAKNITREGMNMYSSAQKYS